MRDRDVRRAVLEMLAEQHAGDNHTRVVEEMGIWSGSVRIDVAVINGELTGYELKSDRDTLERLPFQSKLYSKVFDRVVLVIGQRHVSGIARKIPKWWGITVAKSTGMDIALTVQRAALCNPRRDPYLIAQLLWKEEALKLLDYLGAEGWRGKRVKEIHQHLATRLPLSELTGYVRSVLKQRDGWLGQSGADQFNMPGYRNLNPAL
jgi:hypothetical protein